MQTAYDFQLIANAAKEALRNEFPNSVVTTQEGWHGRVHIKIVSEAFNDTNEETKQKMVWSALRKQLNADDQGISFVLAYGMDEI